MGGEWRRGAPLVVLVVKNLPANAGDRRDLSAMPGQEEPLEKEMTAPSNILSRRSPWTEKPGWATVHRVTKSQTWLK